MSCMRFSKEGFVAVVAAVEMEAEVDLRPARFGGILVFTSCWSVVGECAWRSVGGAVMGDG